jgi:hypothetical protein
MELGYLVGESQGARAIDPTFAASAVLGTI